MKKPSKKTIILVLAILVVGFFGFSRSAQAITVAEIVRPALGSVLSIYVGTVGFFVLQAAKFIIGIAQWNNFVNHEAVIMGWSLVRDVANMILVIVLLFIAMATIFNVEAYSYKKLLPRLLIMAVAINFSRTIAGLMIDFGQVFMITFVNAWAGAAGGNFVNALKIDKLLSLNPSNTDLDASQIIVGYLFGAILITVTLIVLLAFAFILTLRIVTLWMLVVLAPIAFALSAWPSSKAQKQYSQWWDQFVDNIVVGPTVAFFMWLTLATIGAGDVATKGGVSGDFKDSTGEAVSVGGAKFDPGSFSVTTVGTLENFASYIIGIGMLVASLQMVQQMRVMGAQAGSKMLNWAAQKGKGLAYKYTGARAITERYQAFQRERESARGAKVQEFGARAFGLYGKVQQTFGKGLSQLNAGYHLQRAANSSKARAEKARTLANTLDSQAKVARAAGNVARATTLENRANIARRAADTLGNRAKWVDRAGTAAKIVQGGIALATAPAGVGWFIGAPLVGPRVAKSGGEAAAKADQWKDRKVSSHLDALRDEKRDVIESKANGVNVADTFEQMAAMIKMAQEGWYASADIPTKNKQLQDLGADKRILSRFGAAVERKYEAYKMRDPSGKLDSVKAEKAVINGTVELDKLRPEDLIEGNGLIPALVARLGTEDQRRSLIRTKASEEATRNGLMSYRAANLDISAKRGVRLDSSGNAEAYDDNMQKTAQHAMMAKGDVSVYGFDAKTGLVDASITDSKERDLHRKSLAEGMSSRNAASLILRIRSDVIRDTAGDENAVGGVILNNLNRTALNKAAEEAIKSGDPKEFEAIRELISAVKKKATLPTASANVKDLDDFIRNNKRLTNVFK